MIIFKSIRTENKSMSWIDFENESGSSVSIPIPQNIAHLINVHLNTISNAKQESIERGNEDQSD